MSSPNTSRPSRVDLSRSGTVRFACASALAVVLLHGAVWRWIAWRRHQPFGELLTFWDAAYYTAIARDGYTGKLLVFYPAYPLSVRALVALLGGVLEPQWVGAAFSTLLFLGFVFLCARLAHRARDLPTGLVPHTRLGWLFFLLSPASYVFHSHHTEALFLLLSFAAFGFSGTRRPGWGGFFAALCALTRNQGVAVVAANALLAAWVEPPARRVRAFLLAGVLGGLGVLAFLAFETRVAGSPFAFVEAIRTGGWAHADSVGEMLGTLVFANPWQDANLHNLLRHGMWWLLVVGAVGLAREQPALGVYALLCLAMQLVQGELVNTFRYAAPLFPLFFFLGDRCARAPRWAQALALLLLGLLNVATARHYGLNEWAY